MEEGREPTEEGEGQMEGEKGPEEAPAEVAPEEAPGGQESEEVPEETAPGEPAAALTQEERTWAILAHASILLNLVTGFGGVVVAFVIWAVKKEESKYISFQSLQAWVYQLAMLVVSVILWVIVAVFSGVVSATGVCAPLVCLTVPAGIVAQIALIGYGCYGAYACSEGRDFRYLIIGDGVEDYA
jgi:uncharacterized Tic20 family protein